MKPDFIPTNASMQLPPINRRTNISYNETKLRRKSYDDLYGYC